MSASFDTTSLSFDSTVAQGASVDESAKPTISSGNDVVEFELEFELGSRLGSGTFGRVHKCTEKSTKREFAVKVLQLNTLPASQKARCLEEARICKMLDHENVVRLYNIYNGLKSLRIVFEFVSGGELFHDIVSREHYSEQEASSCMRQVLNAVQHFHAKGIIHRDLKPENILLSQCRTPYSFSVIKVADFGLAIQLPDGCQSVCASVCGTPGYIAPEALRRQPIGLPVDMWSCGVLLYIMLVGYPPFWADDRTVLFSRIKQGQYIFNSPDWDNVSASAKSLVRSLLTVHAPARISSTEATSHPWISMSPNVAKRVHRQSTIQQLIRFNARRRLKLAIMTALASTRFRKRTSAFDKLPSTRAPATAPVVTTNPFFQRMDAKSQGGGGHGTEPFISRGVSTRENSAAYAFNDPLPPPLVPDTFSDPLSRFASSTNYDDESSSVENHAKRTKLDKS